MYRIRTLSGRITLAQYLIPNNVAATSFGGINWMPKTPKRNAVMEGSVHNGIYAY